jgi:PAS domain S-box-containing protein
MKAHPTRLSRIERRRPHSMPPSASAAAATASHRLGTARLNAEAIDRFFVMSPGLMSIAGFDGYFKLLNPAWEETLGYSVDELCATPYLDLVHPDERAQATDQAIEIRRGLSVFRFTHRYRCKDGSYRWLACSATPCPAERLIYGSAQDITETTRTVQRLHESLRHLEDSATSRELLLRASTARNHTLIELGRFKDEVAIMLVHDLNNPLAVVLANYDYILKGFEGTPDRRLALQDSQTAVRRMLRLLSNLVDATRIEDGTFRVSVSELDVFGLLQGLVEERRVLARGQDVSIVVVPSPQVTVTVDVDLVTRTLENVLDNALRHTPIGGRIEISLRELGGDFEIRVGNSGAAIALEARQAIFDKHGQVGSEIARGRPGMGLYFCRLATEAQGGRIWVTETEGLPTEFRIRLPRRVAAAIPKATVGPADGSA